MPAGHRRTRRVAVIGSGVSGLVAAHVLARHDTVVLYEADDRLGGHADTHVVDLGGDRAIHVDTGFIVHNDRTYPTLVRLLEELGVRTRATDMSMSVRVEENGLEYAGAKGLMGLFPRARNLTHPAYLRMLLEVTRFHRAARHLLARHPDAADADETLASFLDRTSLSAFFRETFMRPLVAAVWSCDPRVALDYPARYLFTFLDHHGMLGVLGSPTWRTVVGGSARYVERVAGGLDEVRTGARVVSLRDTGTAVEVADVSGGRDVFDAAVVATHPAEALGLLERPTTEQAAVLGAVGYSTNHALLHTDTRLLPRSRGARASWNYLVRRAGSEVTDDGVLVTYDMTRLQGLDTGRRRLLVTLGGEDLVDEGRVIDEMTYAHPVYTPESVAAQRRLPSIGSPRLAFAGAYHGWGFHEDGARSGLAAAEALGGRWSEPGATVPEPTTTDEDQRVTGSDLTRATP